jgi:hypothetical protein
MVVVAQARMREHALAIAHGHRRIAQPFPDLVRHDLGAGRVEAPSQGAADRLERLQDRRRGRLGQRHDPAERGAHEPEPGDERERRERDDGHEPAQRHARVLQHAQHDEQQQGLDRRQHGGDHQRPAHLVPATSDLRSCQSAARRDEDEAFAAPVGIAHVCPTLPGLRSSPSSASGRAFTMSSRDAPARRAM